MMRSEWNFSIFFILLLSPKTAFQFKEDKFSKIPIVFEDINDLRIKYNKIKNGFTKNVPEVILDESLLEDEVVVTDEVFENIGSMSSLDDLIKELGLLQEVHYPVVPLTSSIVPSTARGVFNPGSFGLPRAIPEHGRSSISARYIENPVRAGCLPETRTVELPFKEVSGTTYFPTCIRLKRCGGCCPNANIHECQSMATEEVLVKVVKIESRQNIQSPARFGRSPQRSPRARQPRRGRGRRDSEVKIGYSFVNVSMVEHTRCDCQCIKRASECDQAVQKFDTALCQCVCKNIDEQNKCISRPLSHTWDSISCKCRCKYRRQCSHGEEFDNNTCQCVPTRGYIYRDDYNENAPFV